ncbi:hypothetical protein AGDE_04095 [Angomonas deanei]|uniref:Succinate dehydrogenase assembly factor 4, mitochondrial n=1 Tax=Angomonas deanei TaxID=59799 RepID=S9VG32_9TRYP|nr:hypothetical protein AGDE_04473 [Angomonas deanei]EPY39833.1 hypothetical protein AGDE_04095 [Angomonas deanei]CAD2222132.1 Protein of unknown function (DUF1674), putative [Angomonas deanei]|eukprot:EPY39455.1 hypothetical protein AGDE_04473 [Angomonas deanei]
MNKTDFYYVLSHTLLTKYQHYYYYHIKQKMMRRCVPLFIGAEGDAFVSVIKNKQYLEHRLALLGKKDPEFKPQRMSDEDIKRFTSSVGSAESLFNKQAGAIPTNVVDEETGRVIGSTQLDPTRYGDWEVNGRCYDF